MNINLIKNNLIKNDYTKIFFLFIFSILLDNLFFLNLSEPPAWDQGYHLSNLFKIHNFIIDKDLDFFSKFNNVINVSDNYRGPLTYLLSAFVLKLFGNTYKIAYLSNHLFNLISLISIYQLGKFLKSREIGIWASIFFSFSPLIINERTNYLIDLALTSFSILCFLVLVKWNQHKKEFSFYSLFYGFLLGLIFLTKPTGIIFFIVPSILFFANKFRKNNNKRYLILELILLILIFLIIIFPWFSRHWITITSSTLNAWKWGVNYQEGLDFNTIGGWIFYFKKLPNAFGSINFFIIILIFIIDKIEKIKSKNYSNNFKKNRFLFIIFSFNYYLISSLMSSKDIRFILPLYPIICIYFSLIFNSINIKKFNLNIKKYLMIFSLTICIFIPLSNFQNISYRNKDFLKKWPHADIIKNIEYQNPGILSVLAVIPDTKELNTFNLEAEAAREGQNVIIRQVVSNIKTFKDDLKYFDWFLIKSKNQGVMSSESKILLQEYLTNSNSFSIQKDWLLPDGSKAYLYRRKIVNSSIQKTDCSLDFPNTSIKQISNGLNIKFSGKGENYLSSYFLLDLDSDLSSIRENISLGQGLLSKNLKFNKCYEISQNIPVQFNLKNQNQKFSINLRQIDKNGNIKPVILKNNYLEIDSSNLNNNEVLLANRVKEVEKLGNYLQKGEYESLFNLVGVLNQSDPKQIYLSDSEVLYKERYKESENIENLYNILISQILQRKINNAKDTIQKITKIDLKNGNAFLAQAIIDIYLLKPSSSLNSIKIAKSLNMSIESKEILKITEGIANLLNMNFKKGFDTLLLNLDPNITNINISKRS